METVVTTQNFEAEVLASQTPVLVDFWATWCGPCRMIAPIVAEIAEENEGKIKVCKVNVDEQPELAIRYGINSIPSLLIFKNGELVNSAIGYMKKEQILALFD